MAEPSHKSQDLARYAFYLSVHKNASPLSIYGGKEQFEWTHYGTAFATPLSMPHPKAVVAPKLRIGISGWSYEPWRGVFYPKQLRTADQLSFASRVFPTIEVNGSFYSLQTPDTYRTWYAATPPGFVFAIKGGRYVTHLKRLSAPEQGLANFFASGLLELGEKLGPILWQLPPSLKFDSVRLKEFFDVLPRTHAQAAQLAKGHSAWMEGRTAFGKSDDVRLHHVLEFRHPSFKTLEFIELLRTYSVAPCVADSAGQYPAIEDLCADFVYVRLHGAEQLYASGYSERQLKWCASRIRYWSAGRQPPKPRVVDPTDTGDEKCRDVFVYFDNDVKVHAPFNAMRLAGLFSHPESGTASEDVPRFSVRTSGEWLRHVASL